MSNGEAFEKLIESGVHFEFGTRDYEQNESNDRMGYTGRWYQCRAGDCRTYQMTRVPFDAITRALIEAEGKDDE